MSWAEYILCTVGITCCEDEGPVSADGIWLKGKKTEDKNSRELVTLHRSEHTVVSVRTKVTAEVLLT